MGIFDTFISSSQNAGIFSMYLPFILTFALIYGLLNKSKILGEGRPAKALNAIIGFSIAFYVIAFTSAGITIATFFSSFFTQTTALIVTVISMVLVLTAMAPLWGGDVGKSPVLKMGSYVGLIVVAIMLWSFSSSGGTTIFGIGIPGGAAGLGFGLSNQDIVIIAFIVVTIGIIYLVTREEESEETREAKKAVAEHKQRQRQQQG
jgi:uncharacterized membrane protein